MRIGKRSFEAKVKGNLTIDFGPERLTSYAGLELLRRFLRTLGFFDQLRVAERTCRLRGDFSFRATVLLMVGMLFVGARRLRHVEFLRNDPLLLRFVGLSRMPSERSLSRKLKNMTWRTWPALDMLSRFTVRAATQQLDAKRWTLDVDGSVLTTGLSVEQAKRGFNPHHRKNPSYYPILATLAQTGHVIGHRNRRGNVHDSHGSARFLRETVREARDQLGLHGVIEVRTDCAFFQRDFLAACDWMHLEYAIKVPMMPWLNLRAVVRQIPQSDWQWVDQSQGLQGVFAQLPIPAWKRSERIAIYRKRVNHKPAKGLQLELFNPDDGDWEYSVVATNKSLKLHALWHFQNGRGIQEKTISELKNGYAFDTIPTNRYSANTAWQKLNILAHNIATTFQLKTGAVKKPRSLKRTTLYLLRSIATVRFEWLNRAARIVRPGGRPTLRLTDNAATRQAVEHLERALAA